MSRLDIWICIFIPLCLGNTPNVLVIIADDLGWNDISLHNPYFHTPYIDQLISESLHLKNYYVQAGFECYEEYKFARLSALFHFSTFDFDLFR